MITAGKLSATLQWAENASLPGQEVAARLIFNAHHNQAVKWRRSTKSIQINKLRMSLDDNKAGLGK